MDWLESVKPSVLRFSPFPVVSCGPFLTLAFIILPTVLSLLLPIICFICHSRDQIVQGNGFGDANSMGTELLMMNLSALWSNGWRHPFYAA